MSSTQDVRFSPNAIEEGRRLANKLWNVSRLILAQTEGVEAALRPQGIEERWILARIDAAQAGLEADFGAYDFSHAVDRLYHLTFDDFCDWYAEAIKPRLYAGDEDAKATALAALTRLLAVLHPVLPHVTEEIWSNIPGRTSRLAVAPWPEATPEYAADLHALDAAQTAARIYRRSGVRINVAGDSLRIFEAVVRPTADGQGDVDAERARLAKEIERSTRMLSNEKFIANAAADVVAAERLKLAEYEAELVALGN